jgi:hypothetical protein
MLVDAVCVALEARLGSLSPAELLAVVAALGELCDSERVTHVRRGVHSTQLLRLIEHVDARVASQLLPAQAEPHAADGAAEGRGGPPGLARPGGGAAAGAAAALLAAGGGEGRGAPQLLSGREALALALAYASFLVVAAHRKHQAAHLRRRLVALLAKVAEAAQREAGPEVERGAGGAGSPDRDALGQWPEREDGPWQSAWLRSRAAGQEARARGAEGPGRAAAGGAAEPGRHPLPADALGVLVARLAEGPMDLSRYSSATADAQVCEGWQGALHGARERGGART